MKKINVVYAGWGERFVLGQLADDGDDLLFEYSAEALQRGLELSPLKLPLAASTYGAFPAHQLRLPGLVSDALPDGWGMLLMDRLFRKEGREPGRMSPLERLAFIGDKAMGALLFEPADSDSLVPADVQLLELANEVRQVMSDGSEALLRELALMGGSPHGARPKVLVNFDRQTNRMWNTDQGAGTPWLVKFPAQHEHAEVCAVEALYGALATACELRMPATVHFDLGSGLSAFGIERFDRVNGLRVPMHTAAGAMHVDFRVPQVDYVALLRLTQFMTRDAREVRQAFERCVFNVIFNNRDDHAKNFSFLLGADGRWQFSPAYDLTFNEGPGGEHQMDICGEARAPARQHLLQLARMTGIAERDAKQAIERIASVAGQLRRFAQALPILPDTLGLIEREVEANRSRML
ncbi:type II toxin-antitoxin system HipA family toxin [Trinickia violacea]|uniref:Type II toxin-antitoxin system HipA family toxin n=1 Tax=Trinickia violacea TaxID=2571746 RepID=A0A4P8IUF5_9BURK|nr:type II toxin-antitoxin system HipA family toxin [Trinickia violacea]QCP50724.1 type II toxin-antitoxin system HipA family toxin [Trinickia violacea]